MKHEWRFRMQPEQAASVQEEPICQLLIRLLSQLFWHLVSTCIPGSWFWWNTYHPLWKLNLCQYLHFTYFSYDYRRKNSLSSCPHKAHVLSACLYLCEWSMSSCALQHLPDGNGTCQAIAPEPPLCLATEMFRVISMATAATWKAHYIVYSVIMPPEMDTRPGWEGVMGGTGTILITGPNPAHPELVWLESWSLSAFRSVPKLPVPGLW